MRYFKINQIALEEIFNLFQSWHHIAYTEDEGEYLTRCITDDDGNKPDERINDRIFDLEYVEESK